MIPTKEYVDKATGLGIQVYLCPPTKYIITHLQKLLPAWNLAPQTLIIICFQSQFELKQGSNNVEGEKDKLFAKFLQLGRNLKLACDQEKISLEIICPKLGKPFYSAQGQITFDIVAVINQALFFDFEISGNCKILIHPIWQAAVYPSLLISSASPEKIAAILPQIV